MTFGRFQVVEISNFLHVKFDTVKRGSKHGDTVLSQSYTPIGYVPLALSTTETCLSSDQRGRTSECDESPERGLRTGSDAESLVAS